MDEKIVERAKFLLDSCQTFLVSTNDRNGFPNTIVVSKPVIRLGFYSLKFFANGDGLTAENIGRNSKGNVLCYSEDSHESVLLKGTFTIEDIKDFKIVEERLNSFQKQLDYENPVILSFEAYTVKVYSYEKTVWRDVKQLDEE